VVALNISSEALVVPVPSGAIQICTNRERDREAVPGDLRLAPFEGLILEHP
jgi:hypothetical protein